RHGVGRRRKVLDLTPCLLGPCLVGLILAGVFCPIAGHPLPSTLYLIPAARDPASARRHGPVGSRYPKKIIPVAVPGPVARNPDDIVALRLLVGRDLVDRRRGVLGDDRSAPRSANRPVRARPRHTH